MYGSSFPNANKVIITCAEESLYLPLRNENVANWQIVHKHKKKERAKMCRFSCVFFFNLKKMQGLV